MNVPQLRFKGFNEKWQHRKISEVMTVKAGGDVDKAKLKVTGKYPVIANALTNNGIIGYYDDYQIKAPAVTITGRGTLGHAVARFVSFTPVVRLLVARSATMNANFIANAINRLHIYNESTGVPQLTAVQLKTYAINYPILSEQQKIGTFFSKLDDLITKQTQKLALLKQLKCGYLQKLFPQAGQTTPQLRFKGFNDEWQILKANKIFTSISDKNHNMLPVLSATQTKGMVYRDDVGINIKYNRKGLNNYKHVLPGNFVIHLRSFQSGFAYSDKEGIVSPAYTVMTFKNEDNDELFWKVRFTSSNFIKRLVTITYGIRDGRSINYKDFETLKFSVPLYEEQQKIGALFAKLDHLIELQNRKLELLEELKKGYLQKMFI